MSPNQLDQRTADDVIADALAVVRREYAVCEINSMLKVTICAAALGDIASFAGLYESTASWLLRLVRRITGPQDAEDVLADVYLQVWRSLPEYDDKRGEPLAWLATIARSRALDRLRTERRRHGGHPQAAGPAVDKESDNAGPEVVRVNYPVRPTTTILAGGGGEIY